MLADRTKLAGWLALLLPAALVGGAHFSELFGLVPCEMCWWQRWPHYAAVVVAAIGLVLPGAGLRRGAVVLAGLLVAVSGAIGVFHAGVEYHWWQGVTACTTSLQGGDPMDILNQALRKPLIRCDSPQWTLFGISLAGFNAIFSLSGAAVILWLALGRRHAR